MTMQERVAAAAVLAAALAVSCPAWADQAFDDQRPPAEVAAAIQDARVVARAAEHVHDTRVRLRVQIGQVLRQSQ